MHKQPPIPNHPFITYLLNDPSSLPRSLLTPSLLKILDPISVSFLFTLLCTNLHLNNIPNTRENTHALRLLRDLKLIWRTERVMQLVDGVRAGMCVVSWKVWFGREIDEWEVERSNYVGEDYFDKERNMVVNKEMNKDLKVSKERRYSCEVAERNNILTKKITKYNLDKLEINCKDKYVLNKRNEEIATFQLETQKIGKQNNYEHIKKTNTFFKKNFTREINNNNIKKTDHNRYEEILNLIVNKKSISATSVVRKILLRAEVIDYNLDITNKGFEFLLKTRTEQLWVLVFTIMKMLDCNENNMLEIILEMSLLGEGVFLVKNEEKLFLEHLEIIGLVDVLEVRVNDIDNKLGRNEISTTNYIRYENDNNYSSDLVRDNIVVDENSAFTNEINNFNVEAKTQYNNYNINNFIDSTNDYNNECINNECVNNECVNNNLHISNYNRANYNHDINNKRCLNNANDYNINVDNDTNSDVGNQTTSTFDSKINFNNKSKRKLEDKNCNKKRKMSNEIQKTRKILNKKEEEVFFDNLINRENIKKAVRIKNLFTILFSHESQIKYNFLMPEANFKLYATTNLQHQRSILSLFTNITHTLPNFTVYKISEESITRAFDKGITAEQIKKYLESVSEKVPDNLNDQISIWEEKKNRVKDTECVMFSGFLNLSDFRRTVDFCINKVAVYEEKRFLFVKNEDFEEVKDFIKRNGI
ncbi:hypothetical protein COBT_002913 [Conglomerata obtusa]